MGIDHRRNMFINNERIERFDGKMTNEKNGTERESTDSENTSRALTGLPSTLCTHNTFPIQG